MQSVRIWDLPTRLFHWLLAVAVLAMLATGMTGGDALNAHMRIGYAVFALLVFRLAWGVAGGRWSRFSSFVPTPARIVRYVRGNASAAEVAGHNPLGALSVLAMLAALGLQVGTGLFADDEIAYSGPLTARVSNAVVKLATRYHTTLGKLLVIVLIVVHIAAIVWYLRRGRNLVRPMIGGDKTLTEAELVPAARDDVLTRTLALVLLALAAGAVYGVVRWGNAAGLG